MFNKKIHVLAVLLTVFVGSILPGLLYAAQEWRWENPLPQGNLLKSVWGPAENDIHAVGYSGSIIHYNGVSWSEVQSPTKQHLNDIWGSDANNIYAVGETIGGSSGSIVLHYDGVSWSELSIGSDQTLYSVWGMNANDIYAGGWNGRMYHYDGVQWSLVSTGSNKHIYNIWGNAQDDVFAVGADGTIRHFNGTFWSGMTVPASALTFQLKDVWGTSANNVYVVGGKYENSSYHAIILHYDGVQWTEVLNNTGYQLSSLSGVASDFIFATSDGATGGDPVILQFDGSSWLEKSNGLVTVPSLSGGMTFSPSNTYLVGTLGTILHWDGATFSHLKQGSEKGLLGIWCGNNNESFSVGYEGTILHYNGSAWSIMDSGITSSFTAVWGSANNNVFAVGIDGQIVAYDGVSWSPMTSGTSAILRSIWGSAANDVFAGGVGVILHYNGTAWSNMALPFIGSQLEYVGIWGSAANNVYAVSRTGRVLHYDGTSWLEMAQTLPLYPTSIVGTSADDIQVATSGGVIMHYDGVSWSQMTTGISWPNSITANAANNYYYAGSFGTVFHYDGTTWTQMDTPTRNSHYGVCIRSDNSTVVVGNNGDILRYGVVDAVPEVQITSPANGTSVSEDDGAISFSATASDLEDGDLTASITWSSDLDGVFVPPAALSAGTHTITASVQDSAGQTGNAAITFTVIPHVNILPVLSIQSPLTGSIFEAGTSVTLGATATDAEDGDISASISWSSNLDGALTSPVVLSSGIHQITASVTDSHNGTQTATVTITVNDPPGQPIANAGLDQIVNEADTVTLSGSGTDSNGTIISYVWTQTAGPVVTLSGGGTATASFVAPNVSANTILEFTLTVTDNDSQVSSDSIVVTVNNMNVLPTANAGVDQTVNEITTVSLAGSGTDSDGNIASYSWSQIAGPAVTLSNPNSANPSFTAPSVTASTVLTFALTVTDNDNGTATDNVNVTVNNVAVSYCTSKGTYVNYEWIERITVGAYSNLSGQNYGYRDYTSEVINLSKGASHSITLTPGFAYGSYTEYWRIWIDLNQNGNFETSELLYTAGSRSSLTGSINIPASALSGATRMRISMRYGSYPNPCGNFTYGEVEDYTVNLN